MLSFRFPFQWGSPSAVTVATTPTTSTFWTTITVSPDGWRSRTGPRTPRFEHIYPQQSANAQWVKEETPDA